MGSEADAFERTITFTMLALTHHVERLKVLFSLCIVTRLGQSDRGSNCT